MSLRSDILEAINGDWASPDNIAISIGMVWPNGAANTNSLYQIFPSLVREGLIEKKVMQFGRTVYRKINPIQSQSSGRE